MNALDLSRQDIDQLIRKFRANPNNDDYNSINSWYENNVQYFSDREYLTCIYLFLIGANIKHRYKHISYDQHMSYVKEIRELVDQDTLLKPTRKTYLDFGTKSF